MKNPISLMMILSFLVLTSLSLSAQQLNSYDKREVMAQIQDLDQTNIDFVNDHFDELNNRQILAFINRSEMQGVISENSFKMKRLKIAASPAEYEGLIGDFSEAKMNFLFTKYGI